MAKILVIDDDEHIVRLLQSHLTDEGFEVVVARNGSEAMAQAEKAKPDLIMLDVILPDATGYQICKKLRQTTALRKTPIIMMTGVARYPNQQVYALERGANEYLLKPFKILEVGELVNSYLKPAGEVKS